MNAFRIAVEEWFDRRFVDAMLRRLRQDEDLAAAFNAEETAIYRIPLPDASHVTIHTQGVEDLEIRRSMLELVGLGHRLYLMDSAPLSLFAKPMMIFGFWGLSSRPTIAVPASYHVYLNDEVLPLQDEESLKSWAVHRRAAIPVQDLTPPEMPGVMATMPPLEGPFPPDPRPMPERGDEFEPSSGSPAVPSGTRRLLFYGLSYQGPVKMKDQPGTDPVPRAVARIADAFRKRGYFTRTRIAGLTWWKFDEMMDRFQRDIDSDPAYCASANDQLVICIGAHGKPGSVLFNPFKGLETSIPFKKALTRLVEVQKIADDPKKVYLILYSCHSGQIYEGDAPPQLVGMHILSSTRDSGNVSRIGGLERWIEEALANDEVDTWEELVDCVQWGWTKAGPVQPRPGNGDLGGCEVKVHLRSIKYGGANLGPKWKGDLKVGDRLTKVPSYTLTHGSTTPENRELYHWIHRCSPDPVKLGFTSNTYVDDPAMSAASANHADSYSFPCDKDATFAHGHRLQVYRGGQIANLDLNFEIKTKCV